MHRSSPGVPDTGKTGNRPVGNGLKMSRFGGRIGGPGFRGSPLTGTKFRFVPSSLLAMSKKLFRSLFFGDEKGFNVGISMFVL
jgi:hypothetical protein